MRIIKILFVLILIALTTVSGQAQTNRITIIPRPSSVVEREGSFKISDQLIGESAAKFRPVADLFCELSGLKFFASKIKGKSSVAFLMVGGKQMADTAGYKLVVSPYKITVVARTTTGALQGMQTLLQLILLNKAQGTIPCCEIDDHPRFAYRGVHLDVSRHFYPVSFVKRFLDLMALYKLNYFHWHLTDGAGWRLEINKYPKLTSQAAWRTDGNWKNWWESARLYSTEGNPNASGGYYTQKQAREIVAYAAQRGITVIPEIEIPGHSEEVMAAYPQLSCSGEAYKSSEFCLGNDSSFIFMQDVLTEVMSIFPSKYIHIGGDEANKEHWKKCPKCQQRIKENQLKDELELQSYCIRRMERFLTAHGRKLLGWDEILEGGLAPEATVMSWRGEQGGISAAQQGHDVVMTPGSHCYFDAYQADPSTQPLAIGGFLPIEKVYSYEPIPAVLDSVSSQHILGAQANLWTEYMPTMEHVEYMAFPRLLALSEVVWSSKENRSWDDFKVRLQSHYALLQKQNVNYCRPSYQVEIGTNFNLSEQKAVVTFRCEQYKPDIYYTLDGSVPTTTSLRYTSAFDVRGAAQVCAAVFENGKMKGKPSRLNVDFHRAIGKMVIYNRPYCPRYAAQKENTLVNGSRGTLTYGDGQWQGFETGDMDATIDMDGIVDLRSLSVGFMQQTGPGVFIPDSVVVSVSDNGSDFRSIKTLRNDIPLSESKLAFKYFKFDLTGTKARFVRVFAKNGQHAFLFADEIIVY